MRFFSLILFIALNPAGKIRSELSQLHPRSLRVAGKRSWTHTDGHPPDQFLPWGWRRRHDGPATHFLWTNCEVKWLLCHHCYKTLYWDIVFWMKLTFLSDVELYNLWFINTKGKLNLFNQKNWKISNIDELKTVAIEKKGLKYITLWNSIINDFGLRTFKRFEMPVFCLLCF